MSMLLKRYEKLQKEIIKEVSRLKKIVIKAGNELSKHKGKGFLKTVKYSELEGTWDPWRYKRESKKIVDNIFRPYRVKLFNYNKEHRMWTKIETKERRPEIDILKDFEKMIKKGEYTAIHLYVPGSAVKERVKLNLKFLNKIKEEYENEN